MFPHFKWTRDMMQLVVLELVSGESIDKSNPLQMQRFGPNNSSPY